VRVAEGLGQSAIEQQFKVDKRKVGRRKIATSPMGWIFDAFLDKFPGSGDD